MYWKHFKISFVISFALLVAFFFYLNASINRDDPDYQSKYPLIDAQQILEQHADEDFVVIVLSVTCPGAVHFMPKVKSSIESFKDEGMPFYIINDNNIDLEIDELLSDACLKYGISETIYFIDPVIYPNNGGFFYVKRRYMDFVRDLCGTTEDIPFGYALYLKFNKGQYAGYFIPGYGGPCTSEFHN